MMRRAGWLLLCLGLGLWATPVGAQTHWEANLTWDDNATDELGFRVEKQVGGGGWSFLPDTIAANAEAFTDVGPLSVQVEVCYRVSAFNASGTSSPTAPSCGVPGVEPPDPPLSTAATGRMRIRY